MYEPLDANGGSSQKIEKFDLCTPLDSLLNDADIFHFD